MKNRPVRVVNPCALSHPAIAPLVSPAALRSNALATAEASFGTCSDIPDSGFTQYPNGTFPTGKPPSARAFFDLLT